MNIQRSIVGAVTFATLTLGTMPTALADGIVSEINKAPVAPDGNVAGAPTDIVINFDTDLDPGVGGRSLMSGCEIKVTLPAAFSNELGTVTDAFSTPTCAPNNFLCSTAVLLQGWPQHPLLPVIPPPGPPSQYMLSLQGENTLVITALSNVVPGNALPGPGIKQIHLIFLGFRNPRKPGFYQVEVDAQTGPNCTSETGTGTVQILPKIRPSINLTNGFLPMGPNANYQVAAPGMAPPLPWEFLLWDRRGEPMTGVTVQMVNADFALLKQGKRTVGHVRIDTPPGASGHGISNTGVGPSFAVNSPVTAIPTARLQLEFTAGSASGRYTTTLSVNGGNSVEMVVDVP